MVLDQRAMILASLVGDAIVFYLRGKSNERFSLVSDSNLQINGRFIGHFRAGRTRDHMDSSTWNPIQRSLLPWGHDGCNMESGPLKFSYNDEDLVVPEGALSGWYSPEKDVKVERVANKNSVIITLKDTAEIMVNIVPMTKEDDRIHNYKVPSGDCLCSLGSAVHVLGLSLKVDGVLGRTYSPDFENPAAKPGVATPVVGGEEKYRTLHFFLQTA